MTDDHTPHDHTQRDSIDVQPPACPDPLETGTGETRSDPEHGTGRTRTDADTEIGRRNFLQAAAAATVGTLLGVDALSESARAASASTSAGRSHPWVARHGLTGSEYQRAFDKFVGDGYRLTDVSGYGVDGQARYAAVWEKVDGPPWRARHGMTAAEYQRTFDTMTDDGYRLTHVSGYSVDGDARFAAIWEKQNGPAWQARHGMTATEYQRTFDDMTDNGYRLTHVSGYAVSETVSTFFGSYERDPEPRYAAIWEKRDGPAWRARHGMTAADYQRAFDTYVARGYRLSQVSGFDLDGEARFAAIWERDGGPAFEARHDMSASEYQDEFDELAYQGYRLTDVSGYSAPDTVSTPWGPYEIGEEDRYAATWETDAIAKRDIDAIDQQIESYRSQHSVPGIALAISKDERLVFAKGYGQADTSTGEEMRPSHRFRVASISKPITSVAIMQLVEAGSLDLDDQVFGSNGIFGGTYGTPTYGSSVTVSNPNSITVEHLLKHASGWQNHRNNPGRNDPMFGHPNKDHDGLIQHVVDNWPLDNGPGTNYSYLNFGYCVLGRVIEEVDGRDYEQFVQEEVLDPCGIDRMTIAGNTESDRKADEVDYYLDNFSRDPYSMQVDRMDAHGGWLGSPIDLLRFQARVDDSWRKFDVIHRASYNELTAGDRPNQGYGKGWILGGNWHGHNGALPGMVGYLVHRDDGFAFAALANTCPSNDTRASQLRNTVNTAINNVNDWPDYDLF